MKDKERHIPELLAPAGSFEALEAAVSAGADAVYLSGKQYGARKFARNFSPAEMTGAIDYAHMHGVRVHATVNTLIHDEELGDVCSYLADLYATGVDAIIVQDLGLARLAKKIVPDLPLHASTQATIYSREGVMWARKAGFERVILARETPLPEIDRILALDPSKRPEIEIFIHGALCYCISGQCLLSSVIGRRSGNRGMCAQPCRKAYDLVGAAADRYGRPTGEEPIPLDDHFLLSPKDLMLYPLLEEIATRDIAALKIEGRMRSPEYVRCAVSAYRSALDQIRDGDWAPSKEDIHRMSISFSRGFTGGYLAGETGPELMGRERPGNRGLYLGEVVSCNPHQGTVRVRSQAGYLPLQGDGIALEDPRSKAVSGFILRENSRSDGNRIMLAGLPPQSPCRKGFLVFVTSSPQACKKQEKPGQSRFRLSIDVSLDFPAGKEPVIQGSAHTPAGDIHVVHRADFIPEKAQTAPLSVSQIETQIRKTGDPVLEARSCTINYPGDLFIPLGELNRFRREFYAKIRQAFQDLSRPPVEERAQTANRLNSVVHALHRRPDTGWRSGEAPVISLYTDSVTAAVAASKSGCRTVYFEPAARQPDQIREEISRLVAACSSSGVLTVWKWPSVPPVDFIADALLLVDSLRKSGLQGIMVENPGLAEMIQERAPEIRLYGGKGLNIFNHQAALSFCPPFCSLTLSPELSGSQVRTLSFALAGDVPGLEVLVQGNLLAMVSRDDLLGTLLPETQGNHAFHGLKDRTGRIFPVDSDSIGNTRIWNSAETCLVDHLPSLLDALIASIAIDVRGRGDAYAREMTAIYAEALDISLRRDGDRDALVDLKNRARRISRGGITAGYFARGLLD